MSKRVLYIAFHFPPIQTSSGVHRTLAFSRHLAEQDWHVRVLTVDNQAYEQQNETQLKFIPDNVSVVRAFARDTARHFSFKGRYLASMAVPDRWQSWIFGGVWAGLKQIWRLRPDVIVSTYPIASAHFIGYFLHKLTGVPWVADFRDPMLQDGYPSQPAIRRAFAWIEKKAVKHCKHIIFTSPGAVDLYRQRFPDVEDRRWQLIPNGFDSKMFEAVPEPQSDTHISGRVTLLHSGTIYPEERDPRPLFQALSELKHEEPRLAAQLRLVLRATGHDPLFAPMLKEYDIEDLVELAPGIDYLSALQEMLQVDALLLMQASNCNYQTPAKAYEYIRAKRPVLALTDPCGDTAKVILESGVALVAPLDDKHAIKQALRDFIVGLQESRFTYLSDANIEQFSRQHQAKTFTQLLDNIVQQ
ncbi:glycosyltransferase [Bowmanella denitrificans]|uniref:glycosyltransferase n=1 Tax=Bowmanella denitrificans TaxID=366582 RepID=UPI000C99BF96|nr:glycosyltransferase [Bowmanella denitrificans]